MAKNDFTVKSIFKIIIKYVENKISNSTSHKIREREKSKNIIQFQSHF